MSAFLVGLALLGTVASDWNHQCFPVEEDPSDLLACSEFVLEAQVEGKGSPEVQWTLPSGETLDGRSVRFDTTWVGPGPHLLRVRATSAYGSDESLFPIHVQELEWSAAPEWKLVDDDLAEIRVWFRGGTEVRWDWGDGEWSDWEPQRCRGLGLGYHPRPPAEGPHEVRVEVRNCHGDLIAQSFFVGGTGQPPEIERFEAVCSKLVCEAGIDQPVSFALELSGDADSYLYDWNGDGAFDEVSPTPISEHRFLTHGLFVSRVRVVQGPYQADAELPYPVAVLPDF